MGRDLLGVFAKHDCLQVVKGLLNFKEAGDNKIGRFS